MKSAKQADFFIQWFKFCKRKAENEDVRRRRYAERIKKQPNTSIQCLAVSFHLSLFQNCSTCFFTPKLPAFLIEPRFTKRK